MNMIGLSSFPLFQPHYKLQIHAGMKYLPHYFASLGRVTKWKGTMARGMQSVSSLSV